MRNMGSRGNLVVSSDVRHESFARESNETNKILILMTRTFCGFQF